MDKRITFEEAYSKLGVNQFTLQGLLSTGDFKSWDGETIDQGDFIRMAFALRSNKAIEHQRSFIDLIIKSFSQTQ